MKISEVTKQELEIFKKPIKIADGYSFDFYKTVKRIMLYKNDRYLEQDDESLVFWNIASPLAPHFKKLLDIDTKDLKMIGKGETSFYQSWLLNIEFNQFKKETGLALTLNEISSNLTDYGLFIGKLVPTEDGDKLMSCRLDKLYFDQSVKNIKDSTVIEIHELNESEIRDKAESWDNIDELIKSAEMVENTGEEGKDGQTTKRYKIYERTGMFREEGKNDYKYIHKIWAGEGDKEVVAWEEEIKKEDCPYWSFRIPNVEGRLMGIGVYERLFKLQERANTLVNQNAETTAIASLLLLETDNPELNGSNVLTGAVSGQVVPPGLRQVVIQNPGLNAFINEMNMIKGQAAELCMTPAVVTGDEMPSGTPFRGQALITAAAKSAFKMLKEDVGTILAEMIISKQLPSLAKKINREHVLQIPEGVTDIKMFDDAVVTYNWRLILEDKVATGQPIDGTEKDMAQKITEDNFIRNGRLFEVPKGFFNFKYGISIDPTGETEDKAAQNDAYNNILQWTMSNPAIQNNPYFRQYCENNGITPIKMKAEEVVQMGAMQQGQPQVQKPDKLLQEAQAL